jgi:hypothetical protein
VRGTDNTVSSLSPYILGGNIMNTYSYKGPVKSFETCIADKWEGSTQATSEAKARSNLAYQYKKGHNLSADAYITLPGKLVLEKEE